MLMVIRLVCALRAKEGEPRRQVTDDARVASRLPGGVVFSSSHTLHITTKRNRIAVLYRKAEWCIKPPCSYVEEAMDGKWIGRNPRD